MDGVDTGYAATGPKGDAGVNGKDGVSIVSVVKTGSNGEIDTYTITYSDGSTSTFTIRNGKDGNDGHTPEITIGSDGYWYVDDVNTGVKAKGDKGDDGKGISKIAKTSSDGNLDTYTITYTDGSTSTFIVTNGVDGNTPYIGENGHWWIGDTDTGVNAKGDKGDKGDTGATGSSGKDGVSVVSIKKTSSSGNVDTYTITYSDGSTSTFTVTNGTDGKDGLQGIQGIQGEKGEDGHTPVITIGSNGNWYVDGTDTGIAATGAKGDKGDKGDTGETGAKGDKGDTGATGASGKDGVSVVSITKTATSGNVDTYTITYSDGSTSTFTVTNGKDGVDGSQGIQGEKGEDGHTPVITIGSNGNWYVDGVDTGIAATGGKGDKGDKGDTGVSVVGTHIDENGDLICEMSDGTTINAGHVKDVTKHTVNFYVDDDLVYKTTVEDGGKVAQPDDTCLSGYVATSWSSKSDGGFKWLFSVYTVTSDLNLYADDGSAKSYTITLDPREGTLEETSLSVTYNSQYELPTPTRENYIFLGWYDTSSDKKVSSKATWRETRNVTYYTKWTNVQNTYTFDAGDGTCNVDSMVIGWEDAYELPTPTAPTSNVTEGLTYYYIFDGWYLNDTLIPQSGTKWNYSNTGGTLVAKYTKVDCVKYGIYPQTHVSDETLISNLNTLTTTEANGWYLYDGDYYAKLTAKPYNTSYTFDDVTTITKGTEYWFKCEPINWKILESNDGEYKLISSVLLDAHCYYSSTSNRTIDGNTVYANNYKYSDIRAWLNDEFYNSAFSLGKSYIQTVEVDNSASTTSSSTNKYACENTYDKVYLLSYQEYNNESYFADDTARQCKTTDYARANGCYSNTNSSYKNNGCYWTRSPYSYYSYNASYVRYGGNIYYSYVNITYYGVRPALTVKFE